MTVKNLIKLVHSLQQKKYRLREGLFVAEGPKAAGDLMQVMKPRLIAATGEWLDGKSFPDDMEVTAVSPEDLRRISLLQHPQQVVALFPLPDSDTPSYDGELTICLDGVQDPGNLGTIIRIADWFGITRIVCSNDTADAWNPKVVQATMGSLGRISISYTDLPAFIGSLPEGTPVYGTLLEGRNLYEQELSQSGIIVMGNEGKGISEEVRSLVSHKLLIPSFPPERPTAESLNVAIATAITCAEFRRRA